MERFSVADAQARLHELLNRAATGDNILIIREDGTGVQLVPVGTSASGHPRFGSARGMFSMDDDFDVPLEDFRPYER